MHNSIRDAGFELRDDNRLDGPSPLQSGGWSSVHNWVFIWWTERALIRELHRVLSEDRSAQFYHREVGFSLLSYFHYCFHFIKKQLNAIKKRNKHIYFELVLTIFSLNSPARTSVQFYKRSISASFIILTMNIKVSLPSSCEELCNLPPPSLLRLCSFSGSPSSSFSSTKTELGNKKIKHRNSGSFLQHWQEELGFECVCAEL